MYVDASFTAVIAKGCSDDLCMSFDVLFSGHVNHYTDIVSKALISLAKSGSIAADHNNSR